MYLSVQHHRKKQNAHYMKTKSKRPTPVTIANTVGKGSCATACSCKHKNVFKLQLAYFLIQTTLQHPATNPL
jgi:hypothetical protein